ncbi:MAG: glycosyltransferase [bacterium]
MDFTHEKRKLPSHFSLSVIVPAFNEEDNIEPLAQEFDTFLSDQSFRAEVIVVDDGSTDSTAERVLELSEKYGFLKLVRHKQNMGKTAAIESGFAVSRGKRICIFDADLQYDVHDIKRMMDKLDRGFGIVSGIKKGKYQKPFISKIYNKLTSRLFGVEVKDMNSLKLLRRDVMASMFLRKDWHRFMVVLAAEQGFRVAEIPVTLRPRLHGEAKYGGFGRVFIGFTDLIAVWLAERVFRKPMLIFGSIGFVSLGLGFLLAVALLLLRFVWHWGYPPLQTLLLMLIFVGGFSLTLGFLAEAIANLRDRLEFLMAKVIEDDRPKIETARTSHTHKKRSRPQRTSHREEEPKREPKKEPQNPSLKEPPKKQEAETPKKPKAKKQERPASKQRPERSSRRTEDRDRKPTPQKAQEDKPASEKKEPERKPKPTPTEKPEKKDSKEDKPAKEGEKKKSSEKKEPPERKKQSPRKQDTKTKSEPEKTEPKKPEKPEPKPSIEEKPEEKRASKFEILKPTAEPSWGKRERKGRSSIGKVTEESKEAIKRAKDIAERMGGDAYLGIKTDDSEEKDGEKG